MLKGIWKVFLYFDILKQPYEFKLQHNQRNGTPLGGILSLIFGTILLIYFVLTYINIMQESNKLYFGDISFLKEEVYDQNDIIFSINFKTFNHQGDTIYIGLDQIKTYFDIVGLQISHENQNTNISVLNLGKCTQNQIEILTQQNSLQRKFLNDDHILNSFCLTNKFQLKGYDETISNSHIRILFRECSSENCVHQTERESLFRKLTIQLHIASNIIQIDQQSGQITKKNFTTTINQVIHLDQNIGNLKILMQKMSVLQFQRSLISSFTQDRNRVLIDEGIQLEDDDNDDFQIDPILEKLNYQNGNYLQMSFKMSPKISTLYLDSQDYFIMFLDALSLSGGLFTTVFTFLSVVYKFYHRHQIYQHLMNHNLQFDLGKIKTSRIKQTDTNNFLLKDYSFEIDFSYPTYFFLKIRQKLATLCKKKTRIESDLIVFQTAQIQLQKDLDLTHIMEKFYEVEKLKLLLMDDHQLLLFNSLAKPVIQVELQQNTNNTRKSILQSRTSSILKQDVSFKKGIFRSIQQIQDVKEIQNTYFEIRENKNENKYLNPSFIKLLSMNQKLVRILDVQHILTKALQSPWYRKLRYQNLSIGKTRWLRAMIQVCQMMHQKKMKQFKYSDQEEEQKEQINQVNDVVLEPNHLKHKISHVCLMKYIQPKMINEEENEQLEI